MALLLCPSIAPTAAHFLRKLRSAGGPAAARSGVFAVLVAEFNIDRGSTVNAAAPQRGAGPAWYDARFRTTAHASDAGELLVAAYQGRRSDAYAA